MVIRIKKNIRWHLSVCVTIKGNIILLEPAFKPLLNDITNNISLLYDDVYIPKEEADLPLHGFNFVNIEKPIIDFLCCKSDVIHCCY